MNEYTQDRSVVMEFMKDVIQRRFQNGASHPIGEINHAYQTELRHGAIAESLESRGQYSVNSSQDLHIESNFYL